VAYTGSRIIVIIGVVNFLAFFVIGISIGGDALNGKIESGRFYLGDHGKYNEVTEGVYRYSRLHDLSLIITHPAAIGSALWLQANKRKPT